MDTLENKVDTLYLNEFVEILHMQAIEKAFEDAEKFEKYAFIKNVGESYLNWAFAGTIASLLSFLIYVFGEQLSVKNDYLSAAVGAVWFVAVMFVYYFTMRAFPLEYWQKKKTLGNSLKKDTATVNYSWLVSFAIGIGLGYYLKYLLDSFSGLLFGIAFAIALGNLLMGLKISYSRNMLFAIAVAVFVLSFIIIFTPHPYNYLVFGIIIAIPYYIAGIVLLTVKLAEIVQ